MNVPERKISEYPEDMEKAVTNSGLTNAEAAVFVEDVGNTSSLMAEIGANLSKLLPAMWGNSLLKKATLRAPELCRYPPEKAEEIVGDLQFDDDVKATFTTTSFPEGLSAVQADNWRRTQIAAFEVHIAQFTQNARRKGNEE